MPPYSTQVSRRKTKTYSKSTSSLAAAATQGEPKRPAQTCLGDISATRGFVFERPNDLVLQIGQFGEANYTYIKGLCRFFWIIGSTYEEGNHFLFQFPSILSDETLKKTFYGELLDGVATCGFKSLENKDTEVWTFTGFTY